MSDARERFGGRTKREATRRAHHVVATLLHSYLVDAGQPHAEAEESGVPEADADRLKAALEEIQQRHYRAAKMDKEQG